MASQRPAYGPEYSQRKRHESARLGQSWLHVVSIARRELQSNEDFCPPAAPLSFLRVRKNATQIGSIQLLMMKSSCLPFLGSKRLSQKSLVRSLQAHSAARLAGS